MKVLNIQGYDEMTFTVEELSWWKALLRHAPEVKKYTGSEYTWRDENGYLVKGHAAREFRQLWIEHRKRVTQRRRGR